MTVIVAADVDNLGPDTDSRKHIQSNGAPDEALAHNPIIGKSDPADFKLRYGS
jgi:hypothetical protein